MSPCQACKVEKHNSCLRRISNDPRDCNCRFCWKKK